MNSRGTGSGKNLEDEEGIEDGETASMGSAVAEEGVSNPWELVDAALSSFGGDLLD